MFYMISGQSYGRNYYYPYFTGEEHEAQRGKVDCPSLPLGNARAGIWMQVADTPVVYECPVRLDKNQDKPLKALSLLEAKGISGTLL